LPDRDRPTPLVSIVTVCLNAANTIDDTIRSVALQIADFPIEHIVVDGGSSDATREIIDRWIAKCAHINSLYGPDKGIFDAMNKGFRAAQGQYVLFLNADDFLATSKSLASAMTDLSSNGNDNPDLIAGDVVMGNVGRWGVWRHRKVPWVLQRVRGCGFFPVHQGLFTKRIVLERTGGFNARMRLGSDVVFFYDLERSPAFSIRTLRSQVALMRAGGAANAGLRAVGIGTGEIYRHLRASHGRFRAVRMVVAKTIQSVSEVRLGFCPIHRWFSTN
jgi:glycosyltransferase involved in cell wall biosynthesis